LAAWLHLVSVGAPRRGPFLDLEQDYLSRIGRYARCDRESVPASKRRDADERRREEADRIARLLREGRAVVALDAGGRALDSGAFGEALRRWRDTGGASLIVGGPDGHAPELLARADDRLSLGPMTLPHELAWIVLLEQVYRSLAAERGHPYAGH
jgi:23S rRNA (pseudouridine1915-N3)-methyltransferase